MPDGVEKILKYVL